MGLLLWLACLAAPGVAVAHNFWLESHPFRAGVDQRVDVSVHVGIDMRGNVLPNVPNWYSDFSYVDADGRRPMSGALGDDPAGHLWVRKPGLVVVGYRSTEKSVEMDATLFHTYLLEEGLEKIIAAREASGQSGQPVREVYSRCAKSLVQVAGDSGGDTFRTVLGYTLELVPQVNPYTLRAGDELTVQLLFRGRPLAGARVAALRKEAPETEVATRTDDNGMASVRLPAGGRWQVKAVESVERSGQDADYESFWASLTFELSD